MRPVWIPGRGVCMLRGSSSIPAAHRAPKTGPKNANPPAVKAAVYDTFQGPIEVQTVPDPTPSPDGVVLEVKATDLCRSDWHGWMGHDPTITPPHVPGHEIAGLVAGVGSNVKQWTLGDRVTLPFVCGCGQCPQCTAGHPQVCDHQFQPGFTAWGSFAEYVAIEYADRNLVRLPASLDDVTAASLGCRFVTAFRAVVDQGATTAGEWVAVHGCGGVGLSAIMIAARVGARVIAIDINDAALAWASEIGAATTINAHAVDDVVEAVRNETKGGAHVSIDALGHAETCFNSVANLRKRGRHVQVGLMVGADRKAAIPMDRVIANELELRGTHGLPAYRYPALLRMITSERLDPRQLVNRTIPLAEAGDALQAMGDSTYAGITVIDAFS